jgi:hypothetical protein
MRSPPQLTLQQAHICHHSQISTTKVRFGTRWYGSPVSIALSIVLHLLAQVLMKILVHEAQNSSVVLQKGLIAAQVKVEEALAFASIEKSLPFSFITRSQSSPVNDRKGRLW